MAAASSTMSVETDIFATTSAVQDAGLAYFEANDVVCYIPGGSTELQKQRPRVELIAVKGDAIRWAAVNGEAIDGVAPTLNDTRPVAWNMKLQADIVTDTIMEQHDAYIARIENLMDKFIVSVNGSLLPNHAILFPMKLVSGTPTYQDNEGFYRTTLTYGFKISVQFTAWPSLLAT